jgi:hypothetical protein
LIAGTDEGTIIIDWKTGQLGNGDIQVSKYLDMANKMGMYGEIKRVAIVQLGNGLNKKGWRMTEILEVDYHIKTFNLDLELFNRVYPDFAPKYKTYPNTVSLESLDAQVELQKQDVVLNLKDELKSKKVRKSKKIHSEKEIQDAQEMQQAIKESREKANKPRKPRAKKAKQ